MKVFNVADYLQTDEDRAGYLLVAVRESLEESDWGTLLMAINDIAEAEGIEQVAERAKISPEEIHHALQDAKKPEFEIISRIFKALNLSFRSHHNGTSSNTR